MACFKFIPEKLPLVNPAARLLKTRGKIIWSLLAGPELIAWCFIWKTEDKDGLLSGNLWVWKLVPVPVSKWAGWGLKTMWTNKGTSFAEQSHTKQNFSMFSIPYFEVVFNWRSFPFLTPQLCLLSLSKNSDKILQIKIFNFLYFEFV